MTRWEDTRRIVLCRDPLACVRFDARDVLAVPLPPRRLDPTRGPWSCWLEELLRSPLDVSGRTVAIDASDADIIDPVERTTLRELGRALYQRGAAVVRCRGRRIARAAEQLALGEVR